MSRYHYLASPYSKFSAGRQAAFEQVSRVAASLLLQGVTVFCPILHSHPLVQQKLIPEALDNWGFWSYIDEDLLRASRGLIVAEMDGWHQSTGVQQEIKWAQEAALPIHYLDPSRQLTPAFVAALHLHPRRDPAAAIAARYGRQAE